MCHASFRACCQQMRVATPSGCAPDHQGPSVSESPCASAFATFTFLVQNRADLPHGALCLLLASRLPVATLPACGLNRIGRKPTGAKNIRASAFVRGGLVCRGPRGQGARRSVFLDGLRGPQPRHSSARVHSSPFSPSPQASACQTNTARFPNHFFSINSN